METLLNQKLLKLLFVEDNTADAELLIRALKYERFLTQHKIVKTPEHLNTALEDTWDIIFLDYNVPGYGPLTALEDIRKKDKETPVIVVSGAIGEDLAVEVLKAGADDFLIKGKWNRLGSAVRRSLREKESRLQSKAAQRDREEILAVVSHDLRNPLSAVQLNLQQLQKASEKVDIPIEERGNLQNLVLRAQKSLKRMRYLIEDILDETKIAVGRFQIERQHFAVEQILLDLEEVFRPLAQRKSLQFEVVHPQSTLAAAVDPERIFQALGNILGNAIKFTDPGGKIKLWTEYDELNLRFYVSDTGRGISPANIHHVFDRYWQSNTTSSGSLGLGLFIVKGIVDAHNGTISVESTVGKGTVFEISIPAPKIVSAETSVNTFYSKEFSPKIEETLGKANLGEILIIDDDDDMRMVLKDIFVHEHFNVWEAANMVTAQDIIKLAKNVKLILLDYHVDGMTADKIVDKLKHVPIVLVSAADDLEAKANEMGIKYYLRKPIDRNTIVNTVKDLLKIR